MYEEQSTVDAQNSSTLDQLLPRYQIPKDETDLLNQQELKFIHTKSSIKARLKLFVGLLLPTAIAQLIEVGLQFVNLIYAGHLPNYKYLAAMGFSITATNVLCQSILYGLTQGFAIMGAQAFGARNYELVGRYCHQAFFVILAAAVCLFPVMYFLGSLLSQIGINPEIAELVGDYAIIVYPGTILYAEGVLIRRFLQSQRLVIPPIIPGIIVLPIHVGLCQLFCSYLELGYQGIAVAISLTYALKFIIFLSFLFRGCGCVKERETIQPFTRQDFRNWSKFLATAVPALLLQMIEWWSYQISTIICAYVSVEILAAQSVLMNFSQMIYLVSLGASNALTTVVGNAVGMNEPRLAKLYTRDGLLFAFTLITVLVGICAIIQDSILSLFTRDIEILQLLDSVFYLALIGVILDVVQNAENGVLRGLGQVTLPSIVALVVFYLIFQPISISLIFTTDLGLKSIWIVLPFTALLNGLGYLFLIRRINWKEVAYLKHKELTLNRLNEEAGPDK